MDSIKKVHSRKPIILTKNNLIPWLDSSLALNDHNNDSYSLHEKDLNYHPVSREVNNARNNDSSFTTRLI